MRALSTNVPGRVLLLVASVVALLVGPAVARMAGERRAPFAALDGFIVVGLPGLVLLEILPEAFEQGGPTAVLFAMVGLALPRLLEGRLHVAEGDLHSAVTWGATFAYSLHAVIDGAALNDGAGSFALGTGVVLHRIPVGVTMCWLVRRHGVRGAAFAIGLIGLATSLGYFGAGSLVAAMPLGSLGLFQALVGGSLMHVVAGHAHGHDGHAPARGWELLGAGLGLLSLVAVALARGDAHLYGYHHMTEQALAVAPWAVVGAVLALGSARAPIRSRGFARVARAVDPIALPAQLVLLGVRFTLLRIGLTLVASLLASLVARRREGAGVDETKREASSSPVCILEGAAGQAAVGAMCAALVKAAGEGPSRGGAVAWPLVVVAAVALPLRGLAATVVAAALAPVVGAGAMVFAALAPSIEHAAAGDGRGARSAVGSAVLVTSAVLLAIAAARALAPEFLFATPAQAFAFEGPSVAAALALGATLAMRAVRVGPRAMVAGLVRVEGASGHAHAHA